MTVRKLKRSFHKYSVLLRQQSYLHHLKTTEKMTVDKMKISLLMIKLKFFFLGLLLFKYLSM